MICHLLKELAYLANKFFIAEENEFEADRLCFNMCSSQLGNCESK